MNREDIIRMAEQADEAADRKIKMRGEYHPDWHQVRDEAFAAMVAAHEREACARVCENIEYHDETIDDIYYSDHYAKAIRARGEA